MYTCDDCTNLLFDYVYGLLEPEEAQGLREHLAGCPACHAALTEAETQQNLFGKAAQIYRKVPAFSAPSDEHITPTVAASVSPSPDILPLPARPSTRPSRRRWWASAAAAVLLAAGALYSFNQYEQGLSERRQEVVSARQQVQQVEAQFASASREHQEEAAALPDRLKTKQVQVQVHGPTVYRKDAPNQYHVVTKNLDGQPVPMDLTVRAIDSTKQRVLFKQEVNALGEVVVDLPAGLQTDAESKVQLTFEAQTASAKEVLAQDLDVLGPTWLTQLTLNKSVYRVGEVVFFRSLTLDRFSLKPPERTFRLQFALVDSLGKEVKKLLGESQPNGIGAGEFALTNDLNEGEYTLRVSSAAGERSFLTQQRRLLVQRDPAIELEFDRPQYRPGETMNVQARGRQLQNGANAAANQPLIYSLKAPGTAMPPSVQTRADKDGYATFQAQVPQKAQAGKAKVVVQIHDGVRNEKVVKEVSIAAGQRTVEFFPEGGDLVADVPNSVYFRVATPPGEAADLQGRIVDRQGRAVAEIKTAPAARPGERQRLGVFELTPRAGEAYKLQITTPPGAKETPALPAVASGAVALHLPDGVSLEGTPIRVVLHTTGPARTLLVLASCRGHVVDEQFVRVQAAKTELRLAPAPGSRGVLRVTVYEPQQGELVPLAERLVYQTPARQMQLSFAREGKDAQRLYHPGEQVKLGLKAVAENGKAIDNGWLGVCVVDERVLQGTDKLAEASGPAFFYLGSALHDAEGLEDADFLLTDGAEAKRALDLFLGTQGWRRFVRREPGLVLAELGKGLRADPAGGQPTIFNRDNVQSVRQRYAAELSSRQEALHLALLQKRADLREERDQRLSEVRLAEVALSDYEQAPRAHLRLGLGVLALALLAGGALFLAIGFVRALRGRSSPTVAFATAFATLAVCVLLYGLTGNLREGDGRDPPEKRPEGAVALNKGVLPEVPKQSELQNRRAVDRSAAPVGTFTEARLPETAAKETEQGPAAKKAGTSDMKPLAKADGIHLARAGDAALPNLGMYRQVASAPFRDSLREQQPGFGQMNRYFEAARLLQEGQAAGVGGGRGGANVTTTSAPTTAPAAPSGSPKPQPQPVVGGIDATKGAFFGGNLMSRVYVNRREVAGQDFQDTLLWHPAVPVVNGRAQLEAFHLSDSVTTYRIFVSSHDPSGRLGTLQGRIEVRPPAK